MENEVNNELPIAPEFSAICKFSKHSFEQRILSFMKYIKSKKPDDKTVIVNGKYLNIEELDKDQLLAGFSQAKFIDLVGLESEQNNNCSLILDLDSFVSNHFAENEYRTRLINHFSKLKNLGVLIILADYTTCTLLEDFFQQLYSTEPLSNYLVKAVIATKLPFYSFISFQKFIVKTPVIFQNSKVHLAESNTREQLEINKIADLSIPEYKRAIDYFYFIQELSHNLKKPYPGKTIKIELKTEAWSETIDYTLYITDTSNQHFLQKNKVTAILATSSYSNEFTYITHKGRESLCMQSDSSRVILIRPSYFLKETPQQMKQFLHYYCTKLFSLEGCVANFLLLDDINSTQYEVYNDSNIIIRDVKNMSKKDYFRQIVFKRSPNEIEAEVRLYTVPEKDSKSSTFQVVKTNSHIKNQKMKSCLDTNMIITQFIKIACSTMFFMNFKQWETKPIEVLIIGGSIGILPYFMKSIFKQLINVTSLERNEKLKEIGEQYFGFRDCEIKWGQPQPFYQSLDKKQKSKEYDLIIINETNYIHKESISPSPDLISRSRLEGYKSVLSENGALVYNLVSNSSQTFKTQMDLHEEIFETSYTIENSEENHKVTIGLKNNEMIGKHLLQEYFIKNNDLFKNETDIYLLSRDYEKLVGKLIYRREKRLI